jgi:eukaryotic-like serine/threonine-protein kinase
MDDINFALASAYHAGASLEALLDDQSGCWRRGERLPAEVFLDRRPGLRSDTSAVLDLIYHEILLRCRLGERPTAEEYARRFPPLAEQLRAHFEVHEALLTEESLTPTGLDVGPPIGPPLAQTPAVDGYEVLGELGRGGSGVVYRARRLGLKRLTALKVLRGGPAADPREAARLRGEAMALARIGHPNIIQIYEVGETGGRPFLALEFAPGGSLEARLRGGPQPPRAAATLLETLARAVHAAHRAGVVHRDLKPGNVLFAEDGTPKIADFGLAKRLNADEAQTRTGDIIGTPNYMAPEQARGRSAAAGPAADVYALGAILYELLAGRPPFQGETVWETLEQVIGWDPPPPRQLAPDVPRDLETICLKCLHKDPTRRYGGAEALADDLAHFLAGRPIVARPTPAWERTWKWARRRPATTAVVALALALTSILAVVHEADLRTRLARAERQAAIADVDRLLQGIQGQVNAGHWSEASDQLHDVALKRLTAARLVFPSDPRLDELAEAAQRLQRKIDGRLTDESRLRRFRSLRHDVGFDATPFSGSNADDRLRRTRAAVGEAVRLFDLAVDRGGKPGLERPYFTAAENKEIEEGCCELLLELADAEAAVTAGEADRVVALLDHAAQLGVETPLIAARRSGRPAGGAPLALTHGFEWFLHGNDLCRAGRVADAIEAYQKALTMQRDHLGARYALAVCYLKYRPQVSVRQAHLLLAREHLTRCIQQQKGRVWPYLQRAMAEDELGDVMAAEADYSQAECLLREAPDRTTRYALLVNRGVGRIQRHDPAGAVPDLKQAAALEPDELPAYLDLAKAYQDLRQLPEALEQLDQAASRAQPASLAMVFRGRAKVHEQQQDWKAAVRDLELAIRHEPAGPSSRAAASDHRLMGQLLLQGGQIEEALRAADAALAATPADPAPQRLRAEALLRLDRFAEALQALDRYVEGQCLAGLRPEARVYRARAQAAVAIGDYALAAQDYSRALDGDDQSKTAVDHAGRGWCYVMQEAWPLALRDFEETLRLDPGHCDGYCGRGYALARSGRLREAVRDADKALQLGSDEPRTLYTVARIFAQAGSEATAAGPNDRAQRQQYLKRAVELLRKTMDGLPAAQRSDFWRRHVEQDAALNPVRATAGFRELIAVYAAGVR